MATRSHSDLSLINERRLKHIFDCLDNGNNKKALQEAEKLLKKQKDSQCARVLKSLALIRLGRIEESESILKAVHDEMPVDDSTLQTMTICYRELHRLDLIAKAYENAVKKEPKNEELWSHLFMAYVRMEDYKSQNIVAMKLYKLKSKTPYYFWGIMSILMQAIAGKEELSKTMYLPLAEKMMLKYLEDNELEAEAEIQLYLMVLERMGKYEEALKVLESPLKDIMSSYLDFIPLRKAELLIKLGWWAKANRAYKQLLNNNPDQWSYYMKYFDTIVHLKESNWEPPPDESDGSMPDGFPVDASFPQALNFVDSLIERQGKQHSPKQRGPYLARIELLHRMTQNSSSLNKDYSLVDELFGFYQNFGHKPGCFLDISHAISTLNLGHHHLEQLLDKIHTSIISTQNPSDKFPSDINQMQRHLCYCQLSLYLGVYENKDILKKLDLVQEMVDHYHHGLQFGKNLLSTDYQWSDSYCFITISILLSLWRETGKEAYFLKAFSLLEMAQEHSPSNFHIKLLLVKLYNLAGASGASYLLSKSLDIKHIQQETLGYLFCQPLISTGLHSYADQFIAASQRFFSSNNKDTMDYLISCYKFGSFSKIPELVSFKKKLANSHFAAMVTIEQWLKELFYESHSFQETTVLLSSIEKDLLKRPIAYNELTDNRDTSIFRPWTLKDKTSLAELKIKSFNEEVTWLKLRHLLLHGMITAFSISKEGSAPTTPTNDSNLGNGEPSLNNVTNGVQKSALPELTEIIRDLHSHIEQIDSVQLINSWFPLQGPGPSRISSYLKSKGYVTIVIAFFELVLYFQRLVDGSSIIEEESEEKMKHDINDTFKGMLESFKNEHVEPAMDHQISLEQTRKALEDLTHIVETFCISTVVLCICHILIKPLRGRRGKKKKQPVSDQHADTLGNYTKLVAGLETFARDLLAICQSLETALHLSSFHSLSLQENDNQQPRLMEEKAMENITSAVMNKLEKSYHQSIKELSDLVQAKVKLLQTL